MVTDDATVISLFKHVLTTDPVAASRCAMAAMGWEEGQIWANGVNDSLKSYGRLTTRATWREVFMLGGSPPIAERLKNPFSEGQGVLDHPILLASALIYAGQKEEAVAYMDAAKTIAPTTMTNSKAFWQAAHICPIGPEAIGREPRELNGAVGRYDLPYWHTTKSYRSNLLRQTPSYHITHPQLRSVLQADPAHGHAVKSYASDFIRRRLSENLTSFGAVIGAIPLAGADVARRALDKSKRTTRALFATLPDATFAEMKDALRWLKQCGVGPAQTVMAHIGRVPTLEELQTIKGKQFAHFLHQLPWVVLEKIAADESTLMALRARLSCHLDDAPLDILQTALLNHAHRPAWDPLKYAKVATTRQTVEESSWAPWADQLLAIRKRNIDRRSHLLELAGGDGEVVGGIMAASGGLYHPLVMDIVMRHPLFEEISDCPEMYFPELPVEVP